MAELSTLQTDLQQIKNRMQSAKTSVKAVNARMDSKEVVLDAPHPHPPIYL